MRILEEFWHGKMIMNYIYFLIGEIPLEPIALMDSIVNHYRFFLMKLL